MHYLDEKNIFLFLIQFFLILGGCKLLGLGFQRFKQPTITADILIGIILGPTIFGRFFPAVHGYIFPQDIVQQTMLETIAWTGILFLLLETGLEVNFSNVWRQRSRAVKISLLDLVLPIIITGVPIFFLPAGVTGNPENRVLFTVFLATIMTISAMPVAIRAMHDLNILKTDMGFLIVSALSINDILGWIIFTILLGVFTQATVNIVNIVTVVTATLGFVAFCLIVLRKIADRTISSIKHRFPEHLGISISFITVLGLICGAITQRIGIHSLFGFFIAGLVVGEAKDLSERDRNVFSKLVYAIFIPLFFANIGLKIDFLRSFDILLVLFITMIGIAGRFAAAWTGAVWAKRPVSNRVPIAIAHTPGGEMHMVVGLLALEYGLITEKVFVAIICGAVISSIVLGPWLSSTLKRRSSVNISKLLSRESIIPFLDTDSKKATISALCEAASRIARLETVMIEDAVIEREESMSTAVEEGVAFPHGKIADLKRPVLIFGRSAAGIDWNSPDGKKTRFIFLILTPVGDEDLQIQILKSLSEMMAAPEKRAVLLNAGDVDELLKAFRKIIDEG
jgi:Kef-type K+ transport system membrane component KefB